EPDQLGSEIRKSISLSLCIAVVDDDILTFHVAKLAQTALESFDTCRVGRGRASHQQTYPRNFLWLLRLNGERRETEAESENEPDQPHAARESSRTPLCAPAPRPG